jgi:hypothetical protein
MTAIRLSRPAASEDIGQLTAMYRRMASMDPPAFRSLAGELQRTSDANTASASLLPGPATQTQVSRDAQRAEAAQAALSSVDSDGRATGC